MLLKVLPVVEHIGLNILGQMHKGSSPITAPKQQRPTKLYRDITIVSNTKILSGKDMFLRMDQNCISVVDLLLKPTSKS